MLERPSVLESPRDPFTALWWTESSFDGSPCRNSSFGKVNLSRLKESNDRSNELDLEGAPKKLTWVSREAHRSSSPRNMGGNDWLSIQNGSGQGRSARFAVADSPRRGIHNATESPGRIGESVRRIRTPSMDFDSREVPSSATASRRLRSFNHAPRSASFKEGSAVAKIDHKAVRDASANWRGLTSTAVVRDQGAPPKPRVPITEHSPRTFPSTTESPESDKMVVSYLAEETDRIIKERIQKLKVQFHSNAADQLRTTEHEKSSAGEATRTNDIGRWSLSRYFDSTNAERVTEISENMANDQVRVGGREQDDESSNSPASSMPSSPSLPISPLPPQYNALSTIGTGNVPPVRTISATMENYLDNRRRGSNMGPQIIAPPWPTASPIVSSAASSRSNIAVLRQLLDEPENPSTSINLPLPNLNRVSRHENLTASSRAALSPINGNEDVTHSTTSLSQWKEELHSTGELPVADDDPWSRRRRSTVSQKIARDSIESVEQMQQGENVVPSQLQYWADFLGRGVEVHSGESPLCRWTQQSEEQTSPSGRKKLETKIAPVFVHSNGTRGEGHSSQKERRPVVGSERHSAANRDLRGQSQRYEPEVGRSLLSDKVISVGSRDEHKASRRSQSCRRDSIVNSLLDSSQGNEPHQPVASRQEPSATPSGHGNSSNSKNSSRSSANRRVSSSSDTLLNPSPYLSQIERQKFLFRDSSDQMSSSRRIITAPPESRVTPLPSSRRISVAGHDTGGNPSSSSRKPAVAAGPELRGSPLVSFSDPVLGSKSPMLTHVDKAKHKRLDASSQTKSGPIHSAIQGSQLSVKKKNASQVEGPKVSHKSSLSLDQHDIYNKLFVQTKRENQNSQPVTTSITCVSQACSMPSPRTVARPQTPSSPGSSFQRWLANQFKGGSKARSSSTGKDRDPQEEPKPRKKSPWRTRSAEILQGITRKKGSSTRPPTLPSLDASSLQNLQQGSSFGSDTSQSPLSGRDPWHNRLIQTKSDSTTPHRKSYVLPSISTMPPARTKGVPSQLRDYLRD